MKNYEEAYRQLEEKHRELQKSFKEVIEQLSNERDALGTAEQIIKNSKCAIAIINLDREILWINERAEAMYGFQFQEVKGKRISDLLFGPKTDFSMVPKALEDVKSGISAEYEHIVYKKDRAEIWVRAEMYPLYNRDKEITKILVASIEITKEKELLHKTIEIETRDKLFLKHSTDIVYHIDLYGKITDVNPAWTRILGWSREETLAQKGNHFFYPADVERAKAARQTLVDGSAISYNIDVRVIAKDGRLVCLNTTSVPVYNATGDMVGFTGMSKDITKQKRLQVVQELLATYIRGLISLNDKDRNYIYVSPSFKELTGWDPEELVGKCSFDFYHPDDIPRLIEYRNANIRGEIGDDESIELRYLKKDGTYIWIEINARWIFDEYEQTNRTVISAQVIDKKKQEEQKILSELEEVKKLNQLKTSFLQFVSHEFKTPLAVMKALCEVVKMDIEGGEVDIAQLTTDVNSIDKEILGLVELIEDVLVLEELESGSINLRFRSQSIISIVEDVNERLSLKNKNGDKATINIIGIPQSVPGDSKYLALIFRNLLSNAFKYSEGRPTPIVTIHYFDNQCVISVKDFGIGIPEKELNNLFDNFYRASNVGKIDGTGLGLSLVKKFVTMHGGNIVCMSKENEGTEMYVSLPVVINED